MTTSDWIPQTCPICNHPQHHASKFPYKCFELVQRSSNPNLTALFIKYVDNRGFTDIPSAYETWANTRRNI